MKLMKENSEKYVPKLSKLHKRCLRKAEHYRVAMLICKIQAQQA